MSMVFECAKVQMQERNQNETLLVLDEAGQIKFNQLYKVPSLLRKYGIGTVFGIQDKVMGSVLYENNEFLSLLANLSFQMFGKANLPDTAKFYEQYFEIVKEEQKSISRKRSGWFDGGGADTRETVSEKERAEHRAFEFRQLLAGEFHVFNDEGKHKFARWDLREFKSVLPKPIRKITEQELDQYYQSVIDTSKVAFGEYEHLKVISQARIEKLEVYTVKEMREMESQITDEKENIIEVDNELVDTDTGELLDTNEDSLEEALVIDEEPDIEDIEPIEPEEFI